MDIKSFDVPGPVLIVPERHRDHRGSFSEIFRRDVLENAVGPAEFVQDNHSYSALRGTVRGLHFQVPPLPQAKLTHVVRGSSFHVAVDIRRSSPTYGRHVSVVLSAENRAQLYVPVGFAHGLCTLEPDTEVAYKVTAYYAPDAAHGLAWNDPALGIEWPLSAGVATISERDLVWPRLAELPPWFV
jgi:dTDP-4-dehydrorhamnose 3,5-epimerase